MQLWEGIVMSKNPACNRGCLTLKYWLDGRSQCHPPGPWKPQGQRVEIEKHKEEQYNRCLCLLGS